MHKHKIIVDDFLSNNWLFIKSISYLFIQNACDIIFIPRLNEVMIKLKSIHATTNITSINKYKYDNMILSLKLYSSLNVIENNIIQSSCVFANIDGIQYGFRCSFHPSIHGDCLAIRIINQNYFTTINMNLQPGLTLIAGATGSGKSTLMYSIMSHFPGHVVSLEDPVEYELPHICQTNVQQISYTDAMKSILRQSPDMICIGEIRDKDSANCIINASLTGHIVLSTIHANSIEDILHRINQWNYQNFTSILNRVIFVKNFQYTIHDLK
jgi:competence protein ComGA